MDVVAVAPLPGLGGQVRGHRGEQKQQGVDRLVDHVGTTAVLGVGSKEVDELHARRHRRVVGPALVIACDPVDQPVRGPADGQVVLAPLVGTIDDGPGDSGTASRHTRSRYRAQPSMT